MKKIVACIFILSTVEGIFSSFVQDSDEFVDEIIEKMIPDLVNPEGLSYFPLKDYWIKSSVTIRFLSCRMPNPPELNRKDDCLKPYVTSNPGEFNIECVITLDTEPIECHGVFSIEDHQPVDFTMGFYIYPVTLSMKIAANETRLTPYLSNLSIIDINKYWFDMKDFEDKGGRLFDSFVMDNLSKKILNKFRTYVDDIIRKMLSIAVSNSPIPSIIDLVTP
ncbi:uncharacterized protein LOC111633920 [Centruroides sculpturatus]|uniref:uncharacterized protein LOC111633920 n=1 Tax=Centruroides sculpturatus TaxID=218467 RepID=UPI000C6EADC7|nr:uncharacterized protein LOC111633920 [Centruroides sculpturatus]